MKTFKAFGTGPWLRYAPHQRFRLPYLVDLETRARFSNANDLPEYVVEWPGQVFVRKTDGSPLRSRNPHMDDVIPGEALAHWRGVSRADDMPIAAWLKEGPFPGTPDLWPEGLQYHIAVNHDHYASQVPWLPPVPVGAIPHDVVQRILAVRLAVGSDYMATIRHLEHLAMSLESDTFLNDGFDTAVRDELYDLTVVTVRKFFYMIGDCIWSPDDARWARGSFKALWPTLAAYLWWVGRTGSGLYAHFSGAEPPANPSPHPLWDECFDDDSLVRGHQQDALAQSLWCYSRHSRSDLWFDGNRVTPIVKNPADMRVLCGLGIGYDELNAQLEQHPEWIDGRPHALESLLFRGAPPPIPMRFLLPRDIFNDPEDDMDDRGPDGQRIKVRRTKR